MRSKASLFSLRVEGDTAPIDFLVIFTSLPLLFMYILLVYLTDALTFSNIGSMTQSTNEDLLTSVALSFEETQEKAMTTKRAESITKATAKQTNKKQSVKSKLDHAVNAVKDTFSNLKTKIKLPRKNHKKLTKIQKEEIKLHRKRVILGIWTLIVVVSIAYLVYVATLFVHTFESLVFMTPAVIFSGTQLIKAFSKLYK